jgi:hypothetical protein
MPFANLTPMPIGTRPQPPVGTARVALSGTVFTHEWVNVLFLRLTHTAVVTVNDLETITNGMADSWGTRFAANLSNVTLLNSIDVTFIKAVGQSLQYTHTEAKVGTSANSLPDASACYVINWAIGDYYRGGHPRTYLPGVISTAMVNGSNLLAGNLTAVATAANGWLTDTNALTSTNVTQVELGTVRFQSGNAWLDPPVFKPYQSASIRPVIGTQRRRLIG